MTRIAEIADRLRRLAKRREMEGIYTDSGLCEEAAAILAAIGAGGQAVAVKPLTWEEDHGIAGMGPYRLFRAETPLGRFVYGTDAEGSAYYHTASSGVMMVGDEAKAKQLAEAAWQKAALAEVDKFVDPSTLSQSHPADERVVEARNYETFRTFAHEATKAITNLTGGGSEYFGKEVDGVFLADLPRCVERLRHRLDRAALSAKECRLDG